MTSEGRDPVSLETGSRPSSSPSSGSGRRRLSAWQETGILIAIALLLAIGVKAFVAEAFLIPSESMEPGLQVHDRILVEKPSYWFGGTPERGDVVVFKDPGGWLPLDEAGLPANPITQLMTKIGLYPSGGHLVKRVIGVPGDVVECCDAQGRMIVNGIALEESEYARPNPHGCARGAEGVCYGPMPGIGHWKAGPVPAGMLFVMGDNRAHSSDSSVHLCTEAETECSDSPWVPIDLVAGRTMAVIWPLGRATIVHRPESFDAVNK